MDVKHTLTNQDISNVDIENGQLTFDINGNIYIDYNGTRHQISTMNTSTTSENGLMSSTDKAKLDNIEDGATAVSPSTTIPKVAGTAIVGTETGYSRGDHVHPLQTTISGNAGTATKLETSRTIGLSGAVTGTATSFDGSANITIPTTSIDATYLTGTASIDITGNADTSTTTTNITADESTTTKAYVLGATASGTTPLYDIGVYLDTTSGELHASTFNGYVLGVASEKDIDTEISDTTSTNLPTTEAVVTYVDNALASINSVSTQDTSLTCTLPDDL